MVGFEKLELHLLVMFAVAFDQVRDEPGRQRRKEADADDSMATATDRANITDRILNLRECALRPLDKALPGLRKKHPGGPSDEKA